MEESMPVRQRPSRPFSLAWDGWDRRTGLAAPEGRSARPGMGESLAGAAPPRKVDR